MSPKIAYDVTDVESGQDFDTPVPIGVYRAKIDECEQTKSKAGNEMLALTLEINRGDYKGRKLWEYIVLNEASAWKLRQFLEAVKIIGPNGGKAKGELDPRKLVGTQIIVKVKHEPDDFGGTDGMRARPGALLPIPDDADEEEPDDDGPAATDDALTYADLEEYSREDLEAEADENDVSYNKKTKDDVLLERVAEALGIEPEDEATDDGDDDPDGDLPPYDEWSLSDLKAELKERSLPSSGPKSKLVAALEEDDGSDGGDPF